MDTIEKFEKDRVANGSSQYKMFTTKGFKRILLLMIMISLLTIIYTVFYKLSESNLNTLFERLNSKMMEVSIIGDEGKTNRVLEKEAKIVI